MIKINVSEPEGNVYVILGYAQRFQEQLIEGGVAEGNAVLADVLKHSREMRYDEILDKLESTGLFKFTGRARKLTRPKSSGAVMRARHNE